MGPACFALVAFVCFSVGGLSEVEADLASETVQETKFQAEEESVQGRALQRGLEEGRRKRNKQKMMRMLVSVKLMALSVIIPGLMALALFASWKGITISLLAFTVALFVGIKNLAGAKRGSEKSIQHVIVSKAPSIHEHWWRKLGEIEEHPHIEEHYPHHKELSPYGGYYDH